MEITAVCPVALSPGRWRLSEHRLDYFPPTRPAHTGEKTALEGLGPPGLPVKFQPEHRT